MPTYEVIRVIYAYFVYFPARATLRKPPGPIVTFPDRTALWNCLARLQHYPFIILIRRLMHLVIIYDSHLVRSSRIIYWLSYGHLCAFYRPGQASETILARYTSKLSGPVLTVQNIMDRLSKWEYITNTGYIPYFGIFKDRKRLRRGCDVQNRYLELLLGYLLYL